MALDSYQRPATAQIAIGEMVEYHEDMLTAGGYGIRNATKENLYTWVASSIRTSGGGRVITWRYPYSVERGILKPSPKFTSAVFLAHKQVFDVFKKSPADHRPGAIRLAYPDGLDGNKERAYILKLLTPLERYTALRHAITMKAYEEPRSGQKREKPK